MFVQEKKLFLLYHFDGTVQQFLLCKVMIELSGVSFGYQSDKNVLDNLNLRLEEGRFYGLLGMNGSGKTTLLKLIAGKLFAHGGEIYVDGRNLRERDVETLQKVFMLPADFIFPNMSLEQFLAIYSEFYPEFRKEVLNDCLVNFEIRRDIEHLDKLSLGEKHKVAFSIALSLGTKILLLDEAANGMDIPARKMFRKLLMKHVREDQIVVLSTHIVQDIENLLTDVIVLRKDAPVYAASLEEIASRYSFGIQSNEEGVLYAEACTEGYHVVTHKQENMDTEVSLELLFNALIKGGGRI